MIQVIITLIQDGDAMDHKMDIVGPEVPSTRLEVAVAKRAAEGALKGINSCFAENKSASVTYDNPRIQRIPL